MRHQRWMTYNQSESLTFTFFRMWILFFGRHEFIHFSFNAQSYHSNIVRHVLNERIDLYRCSIKYKSLKWRFIYIVNLHTDVLLAIWSMSPSDRNDLEIKYKCSSQECFIANMKQTTAQPNLKISRGIEVRNWMHR